MGLADRVASLVVYGAPRRREQSKVMTSQGRVMGGVSRESTPHVPGGQPEAASAERGAAKAPDPHVSGSSRLDDHAARVAGTGPFDPRRAPPPRATERWRSLHRSARSGAAGGQSGRASAKAAGG